MRGRYQNLLSEEGKTTGKKRVVCSAQKIKELLTIICSVYLVDKCPPLRYNMLTFNKEVFGYVPSGCQLQQTRIRGFCTDDPHAHSGRAAGCIGMPREPAADDSFVKKRPGIHVV